MLLKGGGVMKLKRQVFFKNVPNHAIQIPWLSGIYAIDYFDDRTGECGASFYRQNSSGGISLIEIKALKKHLLDLALDAIEAVALETLNEEQTIANIAVGIDISDHIIIDALCSENEEGTISIDVVLKAEHNENLVALYEIKQYLSNVEPTLKNYCKMLVEKSRHYAEFIFTIDDNATLEKAA